jgi:lysophospholipase L1-like esterase
MGNPMRNVLTWLLILIISLVMLEVFSTATVYVLSRNPTNAHLVAAMSRFHPLFVKHVNIHPEPPYRRRDNNNHFRFDPRAGFAYRPNMLFEDSILIGPQGFICNAKCEDLPRTKPADEYRIFVFGGSSVAGQGAGTGDQTISGHLERILAEAKPLPGKRIRVVNAGIGGYYSAQEFARLAFEVVPYEPDFVIFFHGNNDYRAWEYAQLNRDLYGDKIRPNFNLYDFELMTGFDRMQSLLGASAHLLNLVDQYLPALHYTTVLAKHVRLYGLGTRGTGVPAVGEEKTTMGADDAAMAATYLTHETNSLATMIENDLSVAGLARGHGFKAMVALQPCLLLPRKDKVAPEETELVKQRPIHGPPYYTLAREKYTELGRANDRQVQFHDLTGIFENTPERIFTDIVHYTPRGNEIIAQELAARMLPMLPGTAAPSH